MMDFCYKETLRADVLEDCKGYVSSKYEAGLLINKRPVLSISSLSSPNKDAKHIKETKKRRRALHDINKKCYYLKIQPPISALTYKTILQTMMKTTNNNPH